MQAEKSGSPRHATSAHVGSGKRSKWTAMQRRNTTLMRPKRLLQPVWYFSIKYISVCVTEITYVTLPIPALNQFWVGYTAPHFRIHN
ncbi:transmembrane protein, putative [Medicago truncatula]|uniref:Transmembrane protein, putative n=1 Tax=Medicago truncatula TaxID=3880 RepID=G7KBV2_MEDTR|nr:transmembrane protein, putative [Medicago truncatula]